MDSLPTGSIQSWLIVAAVSLSPTMALFIADAIGWVRRRKAHSRPDQPANTDGADGGASGQLGL